MWRIRSSKSRVVGRSTLFGQKKASGSQLDAVFSALSDPTRRAMLERLSLGEVSVGEIAKPFQISLPAVSKHLNVLEDAGLLAREREGRIIKLHLDPVPLISTAVWIDEYRSLWETQLDSLSTYIERIGKEKGKQ
jgi:DNA-binding transcriptional ArsR family regulator